MLRVVVHRDGWNFPELLNLLRLDKEIADGCLNEAEAQIAAADVVLLNKVDTVTEAELRALERRLKALNGLAQQRRTTYGDVPPLEILESKLVALDNHPSFAGGVRCLEETGLHSAPGPASGRLTLILQPGVAPSGTRISYARVPPPAPPGLEMDICRVVPGADPGGTTTSMFGI